MIYLLVLLILLYGIHFDKNIWTSRKEFWWYFEWFLLVLLSGLRYRVGGDTLSYFDEYSSLPSISQMARLGFFSFTVQPLWLVFENLCKILSSEFWVVQLIHAIFVNSIIFWFVRKYSKYPFLFIFFYSLIFYTNFNMETMKQSVSNCLFLLSIPSLINKKYLKYYICCIFAFGFHASAIILFFIPLFFNLLSKSFNARSILVILVIALIITQTQFIQSFFKYFTIFSFSERFSDVSQLSTRKSTGMLKGLADFLVVLFYVSKVKERKVYDNFVFTSYLIILAISIPFAWALRLLDYFSIPFYVIVFNSLSDIKRKYTSKIKKNMLKYSINFLLMWVICFQIIYYFADRSGYSLVTDARTYNFYYPYYSIFDPQNDLKRDAMFYRIWEK